MMKKKWLPLLLAAVMVFSVGCGGTASAPSAASSAETASESQASEVSEGGTAESTADSTGSEAEGTAEGSDAPSIAGLTYTSEMNLYAAKEFRVFYYEGGYKVLDLNMVGQFLVVPEGGEVPASLPKDMTVLLQPLTQIYLAATGALSFYEELGALDAVTMTGTNTEGWSLASAIDRLESGALTFAGKYSAPDYEMLIARKCDLALESTMILHAPEVKEMLEDLGIPVLIDRSSYELTALGRVEWIRLYGALMNLEEAAEAVVLKQKSVIDALDDFANTDKTVAFFAINSNKEIVVRRTEDYIPNMIRQAGGRYIFEDLASPGGNSASVSINMETFYDAAVNADYLIYNATIQAEIGSIQELIEKDELFAEFKAVREGHVWQVGKAWYQSTATAAYLVPDINIMLTDGDESGLVFMKKVPAA